MGPEVAVGMLIAWVIAKARRAGQQFDGVADQVVDAAAKRVRDLLLRKLGSDSALSQLQLEGEQTGKVSNRTRQRVELALEDALEKDVQFAVELRLALVEATKAQGKAGVVLGTNLVSGTAAASGDGSSAIGAIGFVAGGVSSGQASDPRLQGRV
jgi:hypothetical protein